MKNQVVSSTDQVYSSNKFGFYAVPKAIKPKYKEQDQLNQQTQNDQNLFEKVQDSDHQTQQQPYYFIDKAPPAIFGPKQRGIDVTTQIIDNQQELFDFERQVNYFNQVEPILEILVGQSIYKSLNQLHQDWERSERELKLRQFERKRRAQLLVIQRQQAKFLRRTQQRERRLLQHSTYEQEIKLTHKKLISRILAKRNLRGIKSEVLQDLEEQGYLRYSLQRSLRLRYLPFLLNIVGKIANQNLSLNRELEDRLQKIENVIEKYISFTKIAQVSRTKKKQRKTRKTKRNQKEKKRGRRKETKTQKKKTQPCLIRIKKQIIATTQKVENILKKSDTSTGMQIKKHPAAFIFGGLPLQISQILSKVPSQTNVNIELVLKIIMKLLEQMSFPIQLIINQEYKPDIQRFLETIQLQPELNLNKPKLDKLDFYSEKIQPYLCNAVIKCYLESGNLDQRIFLLVCRALLDCFFTRTEQQIQARQKEKEEILLAQKERLLKQQLEMKKLEQNIEQKKNDNTQIINNSQTFQQTQLNTQENNLEQNVQHNNQQQQKKFQLTQFEKDKAFLRQKIKIVYSQKKEQPIVYVRLRFPIDKTEQSEEMNQKKLKLKQQFREKYPESILDQYVETFQGQARERQLKQYNYMKKDKSKQHPTIYNFANFSQRCLVYDQRNNYIIKKQIIEMIKVFQSNQQIIEERKVQINQDDIIEQLQKEQQSVEALFLEREVTPLNIPVFDQQVDI